MSARSVCLCGLAFFGFFLRTGFSSIMAAEPVAKTSAGASENCLSCHGPFDKLAAETSHYLMPSGEKTTPHRYVPHDGTNVPACELCHERHRIPLTSKEEITKANIDWCYTGCHHTSNFRPCKECHT